MWGALSPPISNLDVILEGRRGPPLGPGVILPCDSICKEFCGVLAGVGGTLLSLPMASSETQFPSLLQMTKKL